MSLKIFAEDEHLRRAIRDYCLSDRMREPAGGLRIRRLKNAIYDPQNGLYVDGRHESTSWWFAQTGEKLASLHERGAMKCPVPVRNVAASDGPVLYLGIINRCWGHCLFDCTRFLWPVTSGLVPDGTRFAYSLARDPGLPEQKDILPNFRSLLEIAGVSPSRLMLVSEPTGFDEMLFPDEAFSYLGWDSGGHLFTREAQRMFEVIVSRVAKEPVEPFRTVYLSRGKWRHNAKEFGEPAVQREIQERTGCEVVHPETLSVEEQIRLLRETKCLIATEGSIAHSAIFMQRKQSIVLLMKMKEFNRYQPMIDSMRELDVTYIDVNRSDRFYDDGRKFLGPFFLYVSSSLSKFLGCSPKWPVFTRLRYLASVFLCRLYRKIRI